MTENIVQEENGDVGIKDIVPVKETTADEIINTAAEDVVKEEEGEEKKEPEPEVISSYAEEIKPFGQQYDEMYKTIMISKAMIKDLEEKMLNTNLSDEERESLNKKINEQKQIVDANIHLIPIVASQSINDAFIVYTVDEFEKRLTRYIALVKEKSFQAIDDVGLRAALMYLISTTTHTKLISKYFEKELFDMYKKNPAASRIYRFEDLAKTVHDYIKTSADSLVEADVFNFDKAIDIPEDADYVIGRSKSKLLTLMHCIFIIALEADTDQEYIDTERYIMINKKNKFINTFIAQSLTPFKINLTTALVDCMITKFFVPKILPLNSIKSNKAK